MGIRAKPMTNPLKYRLARKMIMPYGKAALSACETIKIVNLIPMEVNGTVARTRATCPSYSESRASFSLPVTPI